MEKTKRITYILLSILSLLLPIMLPIIFNIDRKILITFVSYLVYVVIFLIANLVISLVVSEGEDIHFFKFIPFLFGILLINVKRVYYAELGYFFIDKYKDSIILFKQEFLYCKEVLSTEFHGDIEHLRDDIKYNLNKIYKSEIYKKDEIKRKKESFKNWDGYLDIQSKRDDKINKIL